MKTTVLRSRITALVLCCLSMAFVGCEEKYQEREIDDPYDKDLDGEMPPTIFRPEYISQEDLNRGVEVSETAGPKTGVKAVSSGTDEPKDILLAYAAALKQENLTGAIDCINPSAENRVFVEGMMKYAVSVASFVNKLQGAYGEDVMADVTFGEIPDTEIIVLPEKAQQMGVSVSEDTASLPPPHGAKLELSKKDEKWYIGLKGIPADDPTKTALLQKYEAVRKKVEELGEMIGGENTKAETLVDEFVNAF